MDDALKGKVFQSPQGEINPSVPVQPAQPPDLPQAPVEEQPIEAPISHPETPSQPPFATYEPPTISHPQAPQESPSYSQAEDDVPQKEVLDNSSHGPRFSTINIVKLLIGLIAVLLVAFVIFVLVMPNFGKKTQSVELTFWDVPDKLTISSVLPEFEKDNPSIKVNLINQDIKDYKDKLITRIKNGNGPDLFRFHNTWVIQLSDALLPIPSDVITKSVFDKTFYPVASYDLVKNGAIYGIPVEINTLSLFVNSAMLKKANISVPANWNDFVTASRALTLKDQSGNIKVAGAAIGTFDNVTHAPDIVSMLFAQDSVPSGDISQNKARVSDALNFYTGFAQGDGSVWDVNQPSSIVAFSKENLAMFFGYQKDLSSIKSANPNLSFNVYNVPYLTGQNKTIASYYPIGISLRSRHQKEALIFLKFLMRKDIAAKLTTLPSMRIDLSNRVNGGTQNAVSSYFSGETFDNGLNSKMNSHLSDAINSILSGGSPDSAADNLVLGFSQVLGQFLPKQ